MIEVVLKDSKIDRKERRFPKGGILKEIFSYAINTMEEIETSVRERAPFFYDIIDEIALVSRLYTEKKRAINAVDFDDLLFTGISSFWSMKELRKLCAMTFSHILVDEYQDTNRIQSELLISWDS